MSEEKRERKRDWRSTLRPKHIMVRLTTEEHEEITRRAGLARKSAASFLAYCGLKGKLPLMRKELPAGDNFREEVEKILREMRRIGLNLNGLQHSSHGAHDMRKAVPAAEEFKQAIAEIGDVIGELIVFLKERL